MVKKRLASGEPCKKCVQAEAMLSQRGLFERIDEVVWADETNSSSAGMILARELGVELAPFFIVETEAGERTVHTSVIQFAKVLSEAGASRGMAVAGSGMSADPFELGAIETQLVNASAEEVVRWGLARWGHSCAIAFSGAEDVALIDLASRSGLPFSVFCLDTGRLHAETYQFIERVREHYAIEIAMFSPDPADLEPFVRTKGLFSFYQDGHQECCGIRKIAPLNRALAGKSAWMTGQRKDQSVTRTNVAVAHIDELHGSPEARLAKLNPLANWTSAQVWNYIREHDVPYNRLHDQGYVSIGCEPCTRALRPGEHERAARWWWEENTQRECGLHVAKSGNS